VGLLNDSQQRAFRAAFRRIDELLQEIEDSAVRTPSRFAGVTRDLEPAERRLLAGRVAGVRRQMAEALERLGIRPPSAETTASWVVETAATFAELAIDELAPERLRSYGKLEPGAAEAVAAAAEALRVAIRSLPVRRRSAGGGR